MKAPVQSPTAAGMKMRPASGNGLSNLSSIGVSAMAAAAAAPPTINPYSSSQLSQSPHHTSQIANPSSPIASASPNARRFKTASTPTSAGTAPQAASSPIHSAPQTATPAGTRKVVYENQHVSASTVPASASSSVAGAAGAASYRAHGVHPPVNTHPNPPQSHLADHNAPATGPTIFSPVYHRTASQEQLHQEEERQKKLTAHGEQLQREQAEAHYRQQQLQQQQQQAAAQYAAQQAQAQAQAQAAQQQKHTVSYTPPPVEEDEFDPSVLPACMHVCTRAQASRPAASSSFVRLRCV